jgi:hypothetical protein
MKKTRFNFIVVCVVLCNYCLIAQEDSEPLEGNYTIAKSSEAVLIESIENGGDFLQNFDFDQQTLEIKPKGKGRLRPDLYANETWNCVDAIAVDLNGDCRDELINVARFDSRNKVILSVAEIRNNSFDMNRDLLWCEIYACKTRHQDGILIPPTVYPQNTRLIAGNFDGDSRQEFAFTYAGTDNKFHVKIFKDISQFESERNIIELASNDEVAFANAENNNDAACFKRERPHGESAAEIPLSDVGRYQNENCK